MTKSELDTWRKRSPWYIFTTGLALYFVVTAKNFETAKLLNELIVPIIAAVATYFYVGLGIRKYAWDREMRAHVGKQINETLLQMIPTDLKITAEEKTKLAERERNRKLTGVFWEAIDGNEILRSHKEHFYSNGSFYSLSIDVFIIGLILAAVYSVTGLLKHNRELFYLGIWLAGLGLMSRMFVTPQVRRVHLELSREQLDYLQRERSEFVSARFRSIVADWRSGRANN